MTAARVIQPGGTLGVLGSGQLGRMFAIAARRLGYRVHVLSPDDDTPTGQVADHEVRADYLDLDEVAKFAQQVDVVTFEFENVPAATTAACEKYVPVRPAGNVLYISQNRLREKTYLRDAGLPVTPYREIADNTSGGRGWTDQREGSPGERAQDRGFAEAAPASATPHSLLAALQEFGGQAVLKTADWGYDGKGQAIIRSLDDGPAAWAKLGVDRAILEAFIDFECELSVIAARGLDGQVLTYGPMLNTHRHHILDLSLCPAPLPEAVQRDAAEIARAVVEKLDVIGVLCVEFFLTKDGRLLINETAPRPHNSGHLTIDGHITCQFEQQVRAVCGLPLGSNQQIRPAAMVNLLGDLWSPGSLDWSRVAGYPDVKIHLYGKRSARPGRKMGHLTALADTVQQAEQLAVAARNSLSVSSTREIPQ